MNKMHIYKFVKSHIITTLHQHVSVMTIIRLSYNKNRTSIQIIVQNCMSKPIDATLDFSVAFLMVTKYQIILTLQYSKVRCIMFFY